jgi:hypothetical protein
MHAVRPPNRKRRPAGALQTFARTGWLLMVFLAFCHCAHAQPFALDWFTIDGGGGASTGGVYSVSGTIGQADAGTMAGANFRLDGGFWGGIRLLQTPGAPWLSIKYGGTNAVISWPRSVEGFQLEETTALTSGTWSATSQSVVDTSAEHTVIVPAVGNIKCYRLRKP